MRRCSRWRRRGVRAAKGSRDARRSPPAHTSTPSSAAICRAPGSQPPTHATIALLRPRSPMTCAAFAITALSAIAAPVLALDHHARRHLAVALLGEHVNSVRDARAARQDLVLSRAVALRREKPGDGCLELAPLRNRPDHLVVGSATTRLESTRPPCWRTCREPRPVSVCARAARLPTACRPAERQRSRRRPRLRARACSPSTSGGVRICRR